jgi:hypothetical protein
MKIFQLMVFACFALNLNLIARSRWAITAGPNYTSLHDKDDRIPASDPRLGFNVGGVYEWRSDVHVGFEAELAYTLAGGKGSKATTDLHYLMLPLALTYSPLPWMKIGTGPQAGILLGSNSDFDFRKFDAGVHAAVEIKLKDHVGIQLKNYFGLMYDTLDNNAAEPLSPLEHDYKINRNNIFQINLRYYFSSEE